MFGISVLIATMNQRAAMLATLSPEEGAKFLKEEAERNREELLHKRAVEIAEASRPRNFWGK